MRNTFAVQTSDTRGRRRSWAPLARRIAPAAFFFALAFAADMLTGQRYSAVLGSAAIIASVLHFFPAIRPGVTALGAYASIWIAFNLVRAIADDAPLALAGAGTVATWERALFGGTLPSAWLQTRWFDPDALSAIDIALTFVHGSFFIVPVAVAVLVWWKRRPLFRPYASATAMTFLLGLAGFLLLPTAPPWLSDPAEVTRIPHVVLTQTIGLSVGEGSGPGFGFEPNHLAAMPSLHVAATVLVFLLATCLGRRWAVAAGTYALAMSLSVIYLGEHFVIDAVAGWAIALFGWLLAWRWLPPGRSGG